MIHKRRSYLLPRQLVVLVIAVSILLSVPLCLFVRYRRSQAREAAELRRAPIAPVEQASSLGPSAELRQAPQVEPRAAVAARAAPEQATLTAEDVERIDAAVAADQRQWERDNAAILEADAAEIREADEFMARMRAPIPEATAEEWEAAQEAALQRALERGFLEEAEDIAR